MSTDSRQTADSADTDVRDVSAMLQQLSRIASTIELIVRPEIPRMTAPRNNALYAKLVSLVRPRYRHRAAEIIEIVQSCFTDREIVARLKSAGIISQRAYWRDVTLHFRVRQELARIYNSQGRNHRRDNRVRVNGRRARTAER